MAYWIVKSEPTTYSFAMLQKEKRTAWTGVRNFTARNNLRAMAPGESVLFFHSGKDRAVVGVAKVLTAAAPDPTAKGEDFSKVDLAPVKALVEPVTLAVLKADPDLQNVSVVKMGRLSVGALTAKEFAAILKLGKTKL